MQKNDGIVSFDERTVERKVKKGEFTQEEYQAYLNAIPECEDYAVIDEAKLMRDAGIKTVSESIEEEEEETEDE